MTKKIHMCCAILRDGGLWDDIQRRCCNTARVCRDGKWYCGTHDPVAIKEREAHRQEKTKPIRDRQDFLNRKHYWSSDMLKMIERLAAGENVSSGEARTLAEKVRGGYHAD